MILCQLNQPDVIERAALSIVQGLERDKVNIRYLSPRDSLVGRIPSLEDELIRVGCHPYYEIGYIRRGRGIVAIEDEVFDAQAGDLFIIRPYEIHGIQPDRDDPFGMAWFSIHPHGMAGWVSTYVRRAMEGANKPIIHLERTYEFWNMLEEVLKEIAFHSFKYQVALRAELLHLFIVFIRRVKVVRGEERPLNLSEILPKQSKKRWREAVEAAMEFIRENYQQRIDLETVAGRTLLSPNYFCEVFKAETGVTFTEYVTKVRMAEAKRLLRDTNLSVSEISRKVGYESIHYFSRLFKEREGLSPSEFRGIVK